MALCAALAAPAFAFASDVSVPSEKDETVYVYADATGSVKSTEVSTFLRNADGASELSDSSTLTDIKGEDNATYTGTGGSIVWQANGENVSYKGTTSIASPVTLSVSYMLDGQAITPEELAGKSGKVTIRFDFSNHSTTGAAVNGAQQTIYTPFTCVSALMLDGKRFKNVTVENGKVINDGSDMIVAGYAMPGLKESLGALASDIDALDYFTVTADAESFELKSTMTIVTAGIMSDFDVDSLGAGSFEGASALSDAMNKLIDGSIALTSGLDTLSDSLEGLQLGTSSLYDGAETLSGKIGILASSEGLPALAEGVGALEEGLGIISEAVSGIKGKLAPAIEALQESVVPTAEFESAIGTLSAKHDHLVVEGGLTEAEYGEIVSALANGATMSGTVSAIATGLSEGIAGIDGLVEQIDVAREKAGVLVSRTNDAASGAGALYEGAKELENGVAQLSSAMPALAEGAHEAADGSKKLTEGMQTFNDQGVSQLVSTLQNDYGGMFDRMNAMSDAAKSYTNIGGITPGTIGSVKFVIETDAITKE